LVLLGGGEPAKMIRISNNVQIQDSEVQITSVRSQGSGGQNVNKVSTAIHLRFNICDSSLPDFYKNRLLKKADHRITSLGEMVLKAQSSRSQDANRTEAIERLVELIRSVAVVQKPRKATKPTKASQQKRVDHKKQRSETKNLRSAIRPQ
jgi:ribosome-associated protein